MQDAESKNGRPLVSQTNVDFAVYALQNKLARRLREKGYGTFTSRHEILGILNEEMLEVTLSVHHEDNKELVEELLDVAVGAIFGVACIRAGLTDW